MSTRKESTQRTQEWIKRGRYYGHPKKVCLGGVVVAHQLLPCDDAAKEQNVMLLADIDKRHNRSFIQIAMAKIFHLPQLAMANAESNRKQAIGVVIVAAIQVIRQEAPDNAAAAVIQVDEGVVVKKNMTTSVREGSISKANAAASTGKKRYLLKGAEKPSGVC